MNEEKIRVLLKVVCVSLIASGCAVTPKRNLGEVAKQNVLAEFPISGNGGPILLPVKVRYKEYVFLLDTGTTRTKFDLSLKRELEDEAWEASLGPLAMEVSFPVAYLDLKRASSMTGRNVHGIIGMDFLKKYVVRIDFDKRTIYFLRSTGLQFPRRGEELEIEYGSHGRPLLTGQILDGIKVDFLVDTGCKLTGALDGKTFKKMFSNSKTIKTSEIVADTAAGTEQLRLARISKLSLGHFDYEQPIFAEWNMCCLGLRFLSRHLVTFDFPSCKMYLRKGKAFKRPDEADMSGLNLVHLSDKTVVRSVDAGSPAEEAGIGANDVLLRIGGKDVNTYGLWEIRRILASGHSQKITLTVKRGDDVKDISLVLQKKI